MNHNPKENGKQGQKPSEKAIAVWAAFDAMRKTEQKAATGHTFSLRNRYSGVGWQHPEAILDGREYLWRVSSDIGPSYGDLTHAIYALDDMEELNLTWQDEPGTYRWYAARRSKTVYVEMPGVEGFYMPLDDFIAGISEEDGDGGAQDRLANLLIEADRNHWANVDKREKAVRQMTSQPELFKIAEGDEIYWVRDAAVETMTDQGMLDRLAQSGRHKDVRATAVQRVSDIGLLLKICGRDPEDTVRKAAKERIRSLCGEDAYNAALEELVKSVRRVRSPFALIKVAESDAPARVREAARERIKELRKK